MASIESVTLEVPDPAAAADFYASTFDLGASMHVRASSAPTSGFRGFTLSLVVDQPRNVDAFIDAAIDGGATTLKPVTKGFWGYGGVVESPDGAVWKVATSSKKNTGPAARKIDKIVLLLGVEDVKQTKQFYVDHGMSVAKSFGRKYVEFTPPSPSSLSAPSPITLALYGRRFAAKDAGVSPEGTGSHRIVINSDTGPFTDPDGFVWEKPGP